jgi:UDP-N-acetylmuramoylalanine--D-glutamate ligase
VASEVELAYRLKKAPICAVTGTNGKTTTVTLLGLLLESHYNKVGVGGNIGVPLSEVALEIPADGYIAAEISSYQMEVTEEFHPHVATVLNVTPDHIVRHGSIEEYQRMKERMFAQQKGKDFLVLNYDDERVKDMANRASAHVVFFSRQVHLHEGAYLEDDMLTIAWKGEDYPLCSIGELGIKGAHNVENALAAAMTAFLAGCTADEMIPVLKSFRGVEHRIEYVRTLDGVEYYNDSKATNTDSAIKALETFENGIVLLAGGDDKMTDLTDFLVRVKERVTDLVLIGAAADRFEQEAIKQGYPAEHIHRAGFSMDEAVKIAHSLAKAPQVVLLSPACASFDMYNGMAERGRNFKDLVNKL